MPRARYPAARWSSLVLGLAVALASCGNGGPARDVPTVAASATVFGASPSGGSPASADDHAIAEVVLQAIAVSFARLPPYRGLRVEEIRREGTAASARARFELWDDAGKRWVDSEVPVDLDFVAGGWRIRDLGPVVSATGATVTVGSARSTALPAVATAPPVVATVAPSAVASADLRSAGLSLRVGKPQHVPGVGITLPVAVVNGDSVGHAVTLNAELDVLIRDPAATGWWTLVGSVSVVAPAGATTETTIVLTGVPYALDIERAAVIAALLSAPPVDTATPQVRIVTLAPAAATPVAASPAP